MTYKTIAIIGCNGAIGQAMTNLVAQQYNNATIFGFCREQPKHKVANVQYHLMDYYCESSIAQSVAIATQFAALDLVFIASGMLHDTDITPEKSLSQLSYGKLERLLTVNTIVPALLIKHFLPKLNKQSLSVLAALSARVGSITDNRLGGWYSYRASKAALNMIIQTASIELARSNKLAAVIGLHPGTVDSALSKPFQKNIPKHKLFAADYSANQLLTVIENITPKDSGKCFAWDGTVILP